MPQLLRRLAVRDIPRYSSTPGKVAILRLAKKEPAHFPWFTVKWSVKAANRLNEPASAEFMAEDAGLIVADPCGAEILREATPRVIAPATRRAALLRFAQAAADRPHRLADPGAVAES